MFKFSVHKHLGYVYVLQEGKMVYEHRLAAAQKLGRKLETREVVHHVDEDKGNNSPENLVVFKTKADHVRFHKLEEHEREILQLADGSCICRRIQPRNACQHCGSPFARSHYRKGDRRQVYCSKTCAKLAVQQSSIKPEKEALAALLATSTYCAIGRQFNVSDNAVRKWCKSYGLPTKTSELKDWRSQATP